VSGHSFPLTTSAKVQGPQLSGLLTPFPIFGSVLAVFAAFFLVVGAQLPALAATGTYLLATLAAVTVNGASLRVT
jgi:hypothetical protein